ncbi:SRPBCC family protein [Glutamicibacter arilaitensis]|nr:SRPBCC domain-containing protein [Glutamicibacter arilaitensis]
MSAAATGTRTAEGTLELRREITDAPSRIWRYLTDSDYLALWYGSWHGDSDSGTVEVVLLAEDGAPAVQVQILQCDVRARQLTVRLGEEASAWQLELKVEASGTGSRLVFQMPGMEPQQAGSIGPGWDYYLDRLVAAASGTDVSHVVFEPDYYPALSAYYEELFRS